jgi:hypothetical protein
MLESDTYRAILEEGEIRHARKLVLRMGQRKFGPASDDVVTALRLHQELDLIDEVVMARKTAEELERLERLMERILDVSSWRELLLSS